MTGFPSRVLHSVAYAPRGGLPARHWRLVWLSVPVRVLIALPLVCVLFIPYAVAHAFIWLTDRFGGAFEHFYVTCYNRDLARSGWQMPARYAQPVRINPRHPAEED